MILIVMISNDNDSNVNVFITFLKPAISNNCIAHSLLATSSLNIAVVVLMTLIVIVIVMMIVMIMR